MNDDGEEFNNLVRPVGTDPLKRLKEILTSINETRLPSASMLPVKY